MFATNVQTCTNVAPEPANYKTKWQRTKNNLIKLATCSALGHSHAPNRTSGQPDKSNAPNRTSTNPEI